jgi:hypothetical protein
MQCGMPPPNWSTFFLPCLNSGAKYAQQNFKEDNWVVHTVLKEP